MRQSLSILIIVMWLTGCGQGRRVLSGVSYEQYSTSDGARRIVLPASASDITMFGFYGFDMNYRFIKCHLGQTNLVLSELIGQSITLQPHKTNDTFVLVEKAAIDAAGFKSLFGVVPGSWPSWWKSQFDRFDQQTLCAWQDTNHYGYGYVYLLDSKQNELRVFQWSQQHNTVDNTLSRLRQNVPTTR